MASQFGVLFKVSTFGESHGTAVGCVVDGCPAGLTLTPVMIQTELNRRKPGQNQFASPRAEQDTCNILSGVDAGRTLGTPIAIMVANTDARPHDYSETTSVHRPGHADFTYAEKFGISARSGGGRASARETIGRVAAGAVAKQLLSELCSNGLTITAWVQRIGHIDCGEQTNPSTAVIEASPLRVPCAKSEETMRKHLEDLMSRGDSAGGLIRCRVSGVPAGWGEPVFDKLEADLAKAMLSIPACKSFEIGAGLAGTYSTGFQQNDAFFVDHDGHIRTRTNNSGGIQGGISNGMDIEFAVGFKPVSTIRIAQESVNTKGEATTLTINKGRHDPCVLPRAVPIVEAMSWLVLADHALRSCTNRTDIIASTFINAHTRTKDVPT